MQKALLKRESFDWLGAPNKIVIVEGTKLHKLLISSLTCLITHL